MNPLDEYPEARKYLYMFQWIVNAWSPSPVPTS